MPVFPWLHSSRAQGQAPRHMCNPVKLSGTTSMRAEQQNQAVKQNCIQIAWQWSAAAFAGGGAWERWITSPRWHRVLPSQKDKLLPGAWPLQLRPGMRYTSHYPLKRCVQPGRELYVLLYAQWRGVDYTSQMFHIGPYPPDLVISVQTA